MIKLTNVTDTRTNQFHTEAVVSERNAHYFVGGEAEEVSPQDWAAGLNQRLDDIEGALVELAEIIEGGEA